jgi:hypothetical protein
MTPVPVPRWVRALDAAAVAALLLCAVAFVFGGATVFLGPVRIAIRPAALLFVAIASAAIRHAAHPASPSHRRLGAGFLALAGNAPLSAAVAGFISRLLVLVIGYLAVVSIGVPQAPGGFQLSGDPLFNLPARFDAGWYGGIAVDGYYFEARFDKQQNVAFFPALPLLMRTTGVVAGASQPTAPKSLRMARALWAGVVISILAFAWAVHYLVRLARDLIGEPRAVIAAGLISAYPFAVFFSAPYTEALFLLAAVAAFYHFRRAQWTYAALWGVVAGLTRPNGCLLTVALVCVIAEAWWRKSATASLNRELPKAAVAAATPVLGMLAYSGYVHQLTGSWFGWARLHEAWGRSFEGIAPMARGLASLTQARLGTEGLLRAIGDAPFDALNAAGVIFALAMLWPVTRRLGLSWAAFVLVNLVPPLLAGGLLSMGRLTSTLFPLFVALAAVLPRRAVTPFVTACALGQGLVAALFFTWRPIF